LLVPSPLARGQAPRRLSIAEALARAERTAEELEIARAGVERARGERLQAWSEWWPQIAGSLAYERTIESEFEAIFESRPIEQDPMADALEELPFGREHAYRIGLSVGQNLFAGGRTMARIELARASMHSAVLGISTARAQVVLTAAESYLDAALADRLLSIAEATQELSRQTLEEVGHRRKEGLVPEFDLLRAEVAYENQKPIVLQRRQERALALLRLKQLLELPPAEELELTTAFDQPPAEIVAESQSVARVPAGAERRVPVQQAEDAVRINQAALDIAEAQHWPSLDLSSSYGLVNYPGSLFSDFSDWRTNWTIGVSLNLSLFSGMRISGEIDAAEADVMESIALLRQIEERSSLEQASAEEERATAVAAWRATERAIELAERAHQIAEVRYREGLSTQLELSDARLQLEQARANRAQATHALYVASVRLALLPHLPLEGTVAVAVRTPAPVGLQLIERQPTAVAEEQVNVSPARQLGPEERSP
jgi:outer membrane protein TolC